MSIQCANCDTRNYPSDIDEEEICHHCGQPIDMYLSELEDTGCPDEVEV